MKKLLCVLFVFFVLVVISSSCNFSSDNNTQPPQVDDSAEAPLVEQSPDSSNDAENTEEQSATLTLVVPEGYTAARIGMRLEELGVCTVDEFLQEIKEGDFSEFSLIKAQEYDENRCYPLEGYLFPDSYEIYRDESPNSIIKRMLTNNEQKYSIALRDQIEASGYTVDEIITIASIIEKEAYERSDRPVPEEMPKISSVLHNRLEAGEMIQCNVTATYVKGVLAEFQENGFERYNDYYNTYHCPALPAGAICNPGIDSIKAAVSPADTDYFFFLTDSEKNFYYSATYEEHQLLVKEHLEDNS